MRDGEDISRDGVDDPAGFNPSLPVVHAGREYPSSYPARCAYCKDVLHSDRDVSTHMVTRHPA